MSRLALTERVRTSPYYPALVHPVFRRVLPGAAASALGDGLSAFFAGGVIFGPWMSLSMGVFQDASPPGTLAQILAARSSLLILAAPIGIALGGPLAAARGARGTVLASALATIALGVATVAVLTAHRHSHQPPRTPSLTTSSPPPVPTPPPCANPPRPHRAPTHHSRLPNHDVFQWLALSTVSSG